MSRIRVAAADLFCARCGRAVRRGAAHWPEGYLCATCHTHALETSGRCAGCGVDRLAPGIAPDGGRLCGADRDTVETSNGRAGQRQVPGLVFRTVYPQVAGRLNDLPGNSCFPVGCVAWTWRAGQSLVNLTTPSPQVGMPDRGNEILDQRVEVGSTRNGLPPFIYAYQRLP
jgi:hypothetical protein